jgi:hypothetical protein
MHSLRTRTRYLTVLLALTGALLTGALSAGPAAARQLPQRSANGTAARNLSHSSARKHGRARRACVQHRAGAAQHRGAQHRSSPCKPGKRHALARRACATHPHPARCRARRAGKRAAKRAAKRKTKTSAQETRRRRLGVHTPIVLSGTSRSADQSESSSATAASSAAEGFQPGLNSGSNLQLDVPGAAKLGAKLVRVEWPIGEPVAQMESVIAAYAADGIRVAPLAGFYATMPTPAEAQNLASWAKTFGPGGSFWATHPGGQFAIQTIEFGNETSYGYQYGDGAGQPSYQSRAETYAVRLKEAAEAISGAGASVGLLAQADDWTGDWVNGMYSAVPNLTRYVAGWTIHPYGPTWKTRVQELISQTGAHGAPATIPIDMTEWGLSTDNGRCLEENFGWNRCMSYQEAASTVASVVAEMQATLGTRLGMFMLYQVRDQTTTGVSTNREMYFGALQHELQPKGAYTTAVQALLAS